MVALVCCLLSPFVPLADVYVSLVILILIVGHVLI